MSNLHGILHYLQAILRGIRRGTLFQTAIRFLSYRRVERAVVARYGLTVQAGPFAGMQYITIPPNHALVPKLLGFYEQELHPYLQEAIHDPYEIIINIGSAEGYYAVGLAYLTANARVYAFDIEAREQAMCRKLASLNGISDRIEVRGRCDATTLQTLISGRALVIVDCEGCEYEILNGVVAPKLAEADLLVEIHDFDGSTRIGDALHSRFAETHDITIIESRSRHPDEHPLVAFLPNAKSRQLAVTERIGTQRWLHLRSKMRA